MKRAYLVVTAITLTVVSATLLATRLMVSRSYFAQPGAGTYVFETAAILFAYAVVTLKVAPRVLPDRGAVVSAIFALGVAAGIIEVAGIAVENGMLIRAPGAILSVGIMLAVFGSWAVAGYVSMRTLGTAKLAMCVSVSAAMLCMLVAVTGGLAIQLYFRFGNAAEIVTWAEFKRSGWTDPAAFEIANTLDSACEHLLMGPFIAMVVGAAGVFIATRSKRSPDR